MFKNIVTAALLSSALASASTAHANGKAPCAKVHMMLARGTTESYPGLLGSLTDLVMDAIPDSDYENIIYPATQEGSTPSYEEGIYNGTAQLKAYVRACPETKVVLFGYSQVPSCPPACVFEGYLTDARVGSHGCERHVGRWR